MVTITEQDRVLTGAQCTRVIEQYRGELRPSLVTGPTGRVPCPARVSSGYKLPRGVLRADIADALYSAVTTATGAPYDRVERWELLHYERGGHYRAHVDWFSPRARAHQEAYACGGQRTHSAILYLSTVERGGETAFPKLGRVITPTVGRLVTWNNVSDKGPLYEALHEARPVLAGDKWVLVTWIRASVAEP